MKRLLLLLLLIPLLTMKNSFAQRAEGFSNLKGAVPEIVIDLRYFSSNNFIGDTISGYYGTKCFMASQAAEALANVQTELLGQGLGLKIFDAYRPQQAVDHFVRWAKDLDDQRMKNLYYPNVEKARLFELGYISAKSGHTRGSTADLTIVYATGEKAGQEMDMGTQWDFFSEKSWPTSDQVTDKQKANRMLLQSVMIKNGFKHYKAEWWHFTLKNEPFPDTYFNFPVR